MALKRLPNHYALTSPASIYDEEALTALELAARSAQKVSETIDEFNKLEENTIDRLEEQDTYNEDTRTRIVPQEVSKEMTDRINDGTFANEINEYLGGIETRLDNAVRGMTQDSEVIDARVGNGNVVYATLGAAVRGQTSNIKRTRLDLTAGECRKDTPENMTFTSGFYYVHSGFALSRTEATTSGVGLLTAKVEAGETYLFTIAKGNLLGTSAQTAFIFVDDDDKPVIGATQTPNFVRLVDDANFVYRFKVPVGATKFYSSCAPSDPYELWHISVGANTPIDWLKLKKENIPPSLIDPSHLYRAANREFKRELEFTKTPHVYKTMSGSTIVDKTSTGIALITIKGVPAGSIISVPIGKDVENDLENYFIFESEIAGKAAIHATLIYDYVRLVDSDNYVYHVTIPNGCATFYTACDTADQFTYHEIFTTASLEWLRLKEENFAPSTIPYNALIDPPAGGSVGVSARPILESCAGGLEGKSIYFVGDSILNGVYDAQGSINETDCWYGLLLNNGVISIESVKDAINGGSFVTDVPDKLTSILNATQDAIVVAFGINDYRANASLDDVRNIVNSIGFGASFYGKRVIFITPFDITEDVNPSYTLDEFRKMIYDAALYQNCEVIDGGKVGLTADLLASDGLHPNLSGHKAIYNYIARMIR